MKLKPRRLLPWGIGAILMSLVVYALLPKPVPVDMVEVDRGTFQVTLDEEGETRVRERYVVSAPVNGTLERVELEPGDVVRAQETVLASFAPAPSTPLDTRSRAESEARVQAAKAAVERARAEREEAKAAAAHAAAEAERVRQMYQAGAATGRQRDGAVTEEVRAKEALKAAEHAFERAQHELEVARAALIEGTSPSFSRRVVELRSPIDGVILAVLQESESVLRAGDPILEVADPENLEIVVDYLSTDAVQMEPGQCVLIENWGKDKVLRGKVRRVEPSGFTKISALGVEEQRVNVIIDLDDPHEAWAALGDAYRVVTRIIIWQGDDVLKVPTSALFRRGDAWSVFVVEGGVAKVREVAIGRRTGLEAEVIEGLEEGESVIAYPSDAIEDGVDVERRQ